MNIGRAKADSREIKMNTQAVPRTTLENSQKKPREKNKAFKTYIRAVGTW